MELNITRPTLLLDEQKMLNNLDRMLKKAKATGTELIPHFKTHQSAEIGELFRKKGVNRITVSSVKMAEYFAGQGWNDITIAFPLNILETEAINALLSKRTSLTILVSDPSVLNLLRFSAPVKVLIEVDAGYGRSGVSSKQIEVFSELVEQISLSENLQFYGLYCHPGNTYHAESIDEIKQIWADAIAELSHIKSSLEIENCVIRMGDTPGCTLVENMEGVDEIGPGNFIFYDLVMNYLNVCDESDIAVAVACPVVAKYPERKQVVIHGGAVHFSKDHLFDEQEQKFFGELVILAEDGWSSIIPNAKLISLSQEHGILSVEDQLFETIQIGDILGFLPIHSCLTANLLKSFTTLNGKKFQHLENS